MIDLWTLLVVNLFQGFWMAVIGISFIMYLIFMVGRVSQVTAYNFLTIFALAMSIGYGYILYSIIITIVIFIINLMAIPRLVNS